MTEEEITIEHGCPVCGGPVKGNEFKLFLCKSCNILLAKHSIQSNK